MSGLALVLWVSHNLFDARFDANNRLFDIGEADIVRHHMITSIKGKHAGDSLAGEYLR